MALSVRALSSLGRRRPWLHRQGYINHMCTTTPSCLRVEESQVEVVNNHPANNVSEVVAAKIGRNLHRQPLHPLNTIKTMIEQYFIDREKEFDDPPFTFIDDLSPVVSTKAAFDDLLIAKDHIIRNPSDTYFISDSMVLRPHTSAHQSALLQAGCTRFLATGDVYRRDEIDASHYPVFHQMEGLRLFPELTRGKDGQDGVKFVEAHLKQTLEGLATRLFGDVEMRWVDAYFPFTEPSLELEIFFQGEWLEVLGSGVIHPQIVRDTGHGDTLGWAFGLGLERLAMVLFQIPDIRLFWSEDERFHDQFKDGQIVKFEPYSKYPPCYKDLSLWIGGTFHENDFSELIRGVAGDLVEKVEVIDSFVHPKTQRESKCFRITYRSMDRSLLNEEVDKLQDVVRTTVAQKLDVELR